MKGRVLSDLHLFSRRTRQTAALRAVEQAATEARCLVLCGDIVDLRWGAEGHAATIEQAAAWLEGLARRHPRCRIEYVAGNHDCAPDFLARLADLAGRFPHFGWREHTLRIGRNLFLHGDAVHAGASQEGLRRYRARFEQPREPGRLARRAYALAVGARVHRGAELLFPPRRVARLLTAYLETVDGAALRGADALFCGHTHRPFVDVRWRGLRMFNTGCWIRHQRARVLPFMV